MNHLRGIRPALCAGLLLAGCASSGPKEEQWAFAISRQCYTATTFDPRWIPDSSCDSCASDCVALVIVSIYLLPLAVDTVLLPLTVPHDLLAHR